MIGNAINMFTELKSILMVHVVIFENSIFGTCGTCLGHLKVLTCPINNINSIKGYRVFGSCGACKFIKVKNKVYSYVGRALFIV